MTARAALAPNGLEALTAKIRAVGNIDDLADDISNDICTCCEAERVTIYVVSGGRTSIISKVKTAPASGDDETLPLAADHGIAGYVARNRRILNIKDAHDRKELNGFDPPVYFLRELDKSTATRTMQVLAAPILQDGSSGRVIGVVQVMNTLGGGPFTKAAEARLGRICEELGRALSRGVQSDSALERSGMLLTRTKYDLLVLEGVISSSQLDTAFGTARRRAADIEEVLVNEFQVKDETIGRILAKYYRVPYEPFSPDRPRPAELLGKLKRGFVQSQGWLPLREDRDELVVLATDPEHVRLSGIVQQVFPRRRISYRYCTHREFASTLRHFYGREDSFLPIDTIIGRLESAPTDRSPDAAEEKVEPDSATVQLVNRIIIEAHQQHASDIHIEPRPGNRETKVRFRIDGSLVDFTEIPASYHAKLTARVKIMADLDISNRREPQDGKIPFRRFYPPLDIELRVATIPTVRGKEDVVLRILAAGKPVPLDQTGLSARNLEALKTLVSKPYGLFLVCGPTGSGKTTTLHAVLGHINTPDTKIWTAEDPIEITQDSLRQVQINPRTDLTFARAMRAFLRADPDVIMVGEMRDRETTAIGIEASLTGHRVLATIHTNSAAESIVRLLDLGMDPFNFADALLGVLAQRLAKRLCAKCKRPHVARREEVMLLLTEYCQDLRNTDRYKADPKAAMESVYGEWAKEFAYDKGNFIIYEAAGCDACRNTGYSGRIALHELLVATESVKRNIHERARVSDVLRTAVNEGMRTLRQDGIHKVLQGITDMPAVRGSCFS
jgi:type II secretory ATPase GspE/PulE/Tfp pilus assembly ATPase PilB-like protein